MINNNADENATTRRSFVKGIAVAAAGAAAGAATRSDAEPISEKEKPAGAAKKPIKHILFFVHPPSKFSMNRLLKPNPVAEGNWLKRVAEKGTDPTCAMLLLQGSKVDKPLQDAGLRHFGDRCFLNPSDNSEATRAIMYGDLERTLRGRGNYDEWNPYEIWSANNARRLIEGFKKQLAERGYGYDPNTLTMETFGNWSGCHHKYTNYSAVYLGMKVPAHIHGEVEYCSLKHFPMIAHECIAIERMPEHVILAIYKREDGVPMAQYFDGLRPVWRPPHVARVKYNSRKVDLYAFSPNSLIKPDGGWSEKLKGEFIADVGDGVRPAFTTIVGHGNDAGDIEELCTALKNATIETRRRKSKVYIAVET